METKPPENSSSPSVPAATPAPAPTVMPHQPPAKSSRRKSRLIMGLVAAVLVAAVAIAAVLDYHHHKVAMATTTHPPTSTTATVPAVTPTSGSDNASLNADLNSVGAGLNKENQDQTTTNGAINDQQQEISVPTN